VTAPAEVRSPARRWAVGLIVAGLVLSVLSGHSHRLGFPIGPDRILIPGGVALLALSGEFSTAGRFRWRWVHSFMVATILWATWSAITAETLATTTGFYALLDRILVPFLLFAVAPAIFRTEADRRLLLKALILLGIYLGLTAIFEMAGPTSLVFPTYIMDPDVGILFGRARGPFASSEPNGMVMAAVLFATLVLARRLSTVWKITSAVAAALCTVGVVLTLTRSVWLGTVFGLVAVVLLTPRLRRRLPLIVGGVVALVYVVLTSVPSLMDLVVERLTTQRSVYDRQNTNEAALRIIEEHPIDGVGWSRFVDVSVDWVRQADTYPITNVTIEVHNVVLGRAAELGLIGAGLWVACVLAGPLLAAVHLPRDPELADWRMVFIGLACMWSVVIMVSPTPYPLPNNLVWLLAGMVLRDYLVSDRRSSIRRGTRVGVPGT